MSNAYAGVKDYRMMVEVRSADGNGAWGIKKFQYTFQKPNRIRIDFKRPHSGMIMVYPDLDGKVVVRPYPWAPAFLFRLAPDSVFLKDPSGQTIDRTDLGQLIENIGRSLTKGKRGPIEMKTEGDHFVVQVPAVNHFRKEEVTRYRFFVHRASWLPFRVEESGPGGAVERIIIFRDLQTNIGIPEDFFRLAGAGKAGVTES